MHPHAPPQRFRPCDLRDIIRAEFMLEGPPVSRTPRRFRGAKAAGMRYDRFATARLQERYAGVHDACALMQHPWIRFQHRTDGIRWAQPDGVLFNLQVGRITILEFKLKHTADAWWQLRHLYEPLIRFMFGEQLWHYACCEVVRWHDPSVKVPERVVFSDDPGRLFANAYGVHILN